jgi:osmotically-inducible protein OsmY
MMNRNSLFAALAVLALLGGSAGAMDHPDSWITTKVKAELATHKDVSAIHTKVITSNGVVTLTGKVRSEAEKELAERYARGIEGVQAVENLLVVVSEEPSAMDDASVTMRVKMALAGDRATSALHTDVSTTDGIVTLTGTATSEAEKDLSARVAKDVKGVKSVDNKIEVK